MIHHSATFDFSNSAVQALKRPDPLDEERTALDRASQADTPSSFEKPTPLALDKFGAAAIEVAIRSAGALASDPKSQAAQHAVAQALNDETTANLLNNNAQARQQFLQASHGQLTQAVDAYLQQRPAGEVSAALSLVGHSHFAKTKEGQKVLLKSLVLERTGHIEIKDGGPGVRGMLTPQSQLIIDDAFKGQPAGVAVEVVHEATHAVDNDEYPGKVYSIDEEMRTNTNQLAFYKEVHVSAHYADQEMERRLNQPEGGSLRSDIKSRYPDLPAHRYPSRSNHAHS